MSEIKPALFESALTPQEWRFMRIDSGEGLERLAYLAHDGSQVVIPNPLGAEGQMRQALAALCLHEQPFGFSWEDVSKLREDAETQAIREGSYNNIRPGSHAGWMISLANRIEALLPPEENHGSPQADDRTHHIAQHTDE